MVGISLTGGTMFGSNIERGPLSLSSAAPGSPLGTARLSPSGP